MYYQKRISNCNVCSDEYMQIRELYVVCNKAECKAENKKMKKKEYDIEVKNGERTIKTYRPLVIDTEGPVVRFNNIFILGQYNACSFR